MKKLTQKEQEIIGVERFFKNEGINTANFEFLLEEDEPCDVFCKNIGQGFQLTCNEYKFQEDINVTKESKQCRLVVDAFYDKILNPIEKKVNAYNESAEGIVLLVISLKEINSFFGLEPLFELKMIECKEKILKMKNNFFSEIFLVCPNNNIKLYELKTKNTRSSRLAD